MRRMFELPPEDIEFLEAKGFKWETIVENGQQWLIIGDYPIPIEYNENKVALAINIVSGYPIAPLDMVYCFPQICRKDGKTINGLASHSLDGKNWQRWSRHRTAENPWHPGEDSICTHLLLVEEWFNRELHKN